MNTILWQRIEGALLFVAGLFVIFCTALPFSYWSALGLFFLPDLSLVGYALGKNIGALLYNCCHFYGFGAVMMGAGLFSEQHSLVVAGVLFVAHCGFDRMLGNGLKETTGFRYTHLGIIGKK